MDIEDRIDQVVKEFKKSRDKAVQVGMFDRFGEVEEKHQEAIQEAVGCYGEEGRDIDDISDIEYYIHGMLIGDIEEFIDVIAMVGIDKKKRPTSEPFGRVECTFKFDGDFIVVKSRYINNKWVVNN